MTSYNRGAPHLDIDWDEDADEVYLSCNCHDDFEMTIGDCKVENNTPIQSMMDLNNLLNGLEYQDLLEMHDKFTD